MPAEPYIVRDTGGSLTFRGVVLRCGDGIRLHTTVADDRSGNAASRCDRAELVRADGGEVVSLPVWQAPLARVHGLTNLARPRKPPEGATDA